MQYQHVCLEAFGYTLPPEIVTTTQLEQWLAPLYQRLRLPEGRLELITGIQARRFWPRGTRPSDMSVVSARQALEAADLEVDQLGALIHASVCRDHLEPATACRVHQQLGLPERAMIYDVSNACLGMLNGALQIANMIELGQIRAGLVVGTEGSRQLVENTVSMLNTRRDLTRQSIKPALASLTIGSASCAMLLVHRDLSRTGNRLLAGVARAHTAHHELCQSGQDEAGEAMQPLMETDSEQLLHAGIATGQAAFRDFLRELPDEGSGIAKSICHQVGGTHRKLMLETLGLDAAFDFSTFSWLGNTGSVALPITMAMAAQQQFLVPQDRVAMLGIGSGINSVMLGVDWQRSLVAGADLAQERLTTSLT